MTKDNNLLVVDEYNKFVTEYKAVYQAMTAKHDCKSKIFDRNVKVSKDDICELNDRVVSKLQNYNDAGFSVSVNVTYEGRESIEFSSWQEFEQHNFIESSAINSITIIWEFNALLPQYKVPQKHVLVVKIADGLKPEEMINILFTGKLENMQDIEKQMYPVVARVDFINYVLGDELLNIVNEWNKGLEIQDYCEDGKVKPFLVKHRRKIAFAINYIPFILTILFAIQTFNTFLNNLQVDKVAELSISNVTGMTWVIGLLVFTIIFVFKTAEWMANVFFNSLGVDESFHVFNLNNGDKKLQERIRQRKHKNRVNIVCSILGTIALNIISGGLCNLIDIVLRRVI